MNILQNLVNKSIKSDRKLNILTFLYNGKFDRDLLLTGHNFYGIANSSYQGWLPIKNMDDNLTLLPKPEDIQNLNNIDLVLFNNRLHEEVFSLCKQQHIPGLIIDHQLCEDNPYIAQKLKQNNLFESVACSPTLQQELNSTYCIPYGINEYSGEYEKDIDILISGNFTASDSYAIKIIKQKFPTTRLIGHNPHILFSETPQTFNDYINIFKRTKLFVNLRNKNSQNNYYDLLLAAKYNCSIVTYKTKLYSTIFDQSQVSYYDKPSSLLPAIYNKVPSPNYQLSGLYISKAEFIERWNKLLETYRYKVYK